MKHGWNNLDDDQCPVVTRTTQTNKDGDFVFRLNTKIKATRQNLKICH